MVSVCAGAQADQVGSCAAAKATRPKGRNKFARGSIVDVLNLVIEQCVEVSQLFGASHQLHVSLERFK